jgi:hypothetical protein
MATLTAAGTDQVYRGLVPVFRSVKILFPNGTWFIAARGRIRPWGSIASPAPT